MTGWGEERIILEIEKKNIYQIVKINTNNHTKIVR